MTVQRDRVLTVWLFAVCFFIVVLVIFGGYVRLTRSGLSMVEWNVITGVMPPIGEADWQETFERYKSSPEYLKVNVGMSLEQYKTIYYNEYIHRMLGRFTGLLFVVPLVVFAMTRRLQWRTSGTLVGIALLFALQGFLGWFMVRSGLVDRPSVSHLRLTLHLMAALALLGLTFWSGLSYLLGRPKDDGPGVRVPGFGLSVVVTCTLLTQIAWGGLVAGLKAGHVSDSFPMMFGSLVPSGIFTAGGGVGASLIGAPPTVHFVHRWFAFVVLAAALWLFLNLRRTAGPQVRQATTLLLIASLFQIALGVSVIWLHVPVAIALLHQATALLLYLTAIFLNHRLA